MRAHATMDDEGLADARAANPLSFTQTSPRKWFALHDLDGSLATGDFAEHSSDSDVLVVAEDVPPTRSSPRS